jgi:acyl-ACP thioesterase
VRAAPYLRDVKPPARDRALDDPFNKLTAPHAADRKLDFRVRYSDLDVNQHVNNVCYAEWIVESVPAGVLRACHLQALELQFRAEATLGHTVVVQTQCKDDDDALVFVHRLARRQDDQDVVLARTRWVTR